MLAIVLFLLCCLLAFLFVCWRRNKKTEEHEKTEKEMAAAAAAYSEPRRDTGYAEFGNDAPINTQPSMMDDDEHYGQYEAKEQVELAEAVEVDKQYTLDGMVGTTGDNKGDDAVLDLLADGHDTGNGARKADDEAVDAQEV